MYFLGKAANFSGKEARRHTFAIGSKKDSEALEEYLALRYEAAKTNVALTANGRSALAIALKTLLPKNSKVLINGFTCHAVLEGVLAAKCTPIYADINKKTLHYDAKILENILTKYKDLKAIIIQNSLGIAVDIKPIEKIAKKHGLIIIEDLAHCIGVHYADGREAGTVGDATALSFGKGKAVDTISGGAVIIRGEENKLKIRPTKRQKFSHTFRARWYPFFGSLLRALDKIHLCKIFTAVLLKIHFIERSADAKLDITRRMPHWQAKLALEKLEKRKNAKKPLRDFFLVKDRDKVLKELKAAGYDFSEFWYEVPVSPARYYDKVHFPEKECINSVNVAKCIINTPDYYKKSEIAPAIKIIKENLDE